MVRKLFVFSFFGIWKFNYDIKVNELAFSTVTNLDLSFSRLTSTIVCFWFSFIGFTVTKLESPIFTLIAKRIDKADEKMTLSEIIGTTDALWIRNLCQVIVCGVKGKSVWYEPESRNENSSRRLIKPSAANQSGRGYDDLWAIAFEAFVGSSAWSRTKARDYENGKTECDL